jgi:hypothetical protein
MFKLMRKMPYLKVMQQENYEAQRDVIWAQNKEIKERNISCITTAS